MKITDLDTRVLGYIMQGVGIDRHTAVDVRRAFIVSVGRLAIRHFRELDAVDPEHVVWNDERIAIGGQADPDHRAITGDRYRARQRADYWVRRFGSMSRHIVDWLTVAVREDHAWLRNLDDRGRPKKLLKSGSIRDLFLEAEKQLRRVAQQQAAQVDTTSALTSTDIKWTARLGDDLHIVQLLSAAALDEETAFMGHCIGLGSYDAKVAGDQRRFSYWSVRNNDGGVLATIEVRERVVIQIAGRGNGYAPKPVQKVVEEYMETVGWTHTRPELADTDGGRIRRGSDYYHLQRLFEHPATLEDLRAFQRLADVDQIRVINTLKEAAGLGPHDEVPRLPDPVTEVYHDGEEFIERVVEDPDAAEVDVIPPRPR